jgi:DNA-binding response OmpR family regulator
VNDAARVAVVGDGEDLRSAVAAYLRLNGFDAIECSDGRALDRAMRAGSIEIVVLDVNMSGEGGFAIARRLRADGGIVMLTARTDLIDRVVGLEFGADYYVAKPFELRELVARIRAVLRRTDKARSAPEEASRLANFEALWVEDRGIIARIAVADIEWIEAARDYALLHTASRVHSLRVTMEELL